MTLKELSQLYYLNREIEMDKKRLLELEARAKPTITGMVAALISDSAATRPEARAVSCSSDLSGMPRSSGVGDRVGRYAAEIVDLKGIIEAKLQQCIYERNRLERYITTIEDSLLRQVFTYRFVNGLPWQQVAACIGGSNTADGVRMMCNRYIKATEPETDDGTEVQL